MRRLRLVQPADSDSENDSGEQLSLWRFLSHHIQRYPYDLRAHVQRILLTGQDGLQNRTAGTLLDLFLALGDAGKAFRERMLNECRERLDEKTCALFSGWLDEGVTAQESGWLQGSVLSTGETPPVRKLLNNSVPGTNRSILMCWLRYRIIWSMVRSSWPGSYWKPKSSKDGRLLNWNRNC